jgi:hypothetical protein
MWRSDIYSLLTRSRGCNSKTFYQFGCEEEVENGRFLDTLRRDNTAQLAVTNTIRDDNEEIRPTFEFSVRNRKPVYYTSDDFIREGTRYNCNSRVRRIDITPTNFYIPVDIDKAIRERGEIAWFEEHKREKSEAIINGIASCCTDRQVVRSSQLFTRRAECLRILQDLSSVQTKNRGLKIRIFGIHREDEKETCGHIRGIHGRDRNRAGAQRTTLTK